jgi:hypothetical protein
MEISGGIRCIDLVRVHGHSDALKQCPEDWFAARERESGRESNRVILAIGNGDVNALRSPEHLIQDFADPALLVAGQTCRLVDKAITQFAAPITVRAEGVDEALPIPGDRDSHELLVTHCGVRTLKVPKIEAFERAHRRNRELPAKHSGGARLGILRGSEFKAC